MTACFRYILNHSPPCRICNLAFLRLQIIRNFQILQILLGDGVGLQEVLSLNPDDLREFFDYYFDRFEKQTILAPDGEIANTQKVFYIAE